MAEIPVTKKSGVPWWVWAIVAAIVLILLFWWLGGDDDEVAELETVDSDAIVVADVDAGPITDITTIETATDPTTLAGRSVELTAVDVGPVVGDRTFTVMDDAGGELFVVLDQVPTPGTPTEGRYDINPDQVIDISGTLREVRNGMIDGERIEDMPRGTQVYLWAQTADIEERS
ncbi:hypothetical protein [Parvularcula oceani]|uniref:hypothetical protein n=1 Tax=Parvularcula oceani TaxID=1247963 RepID=UPI0004E1647E|nr:hypothetical protein [Parvularcula oceani]